MNTTNSTIPKKCILIRPKENVGGNSTTVQNSLQITFLYPLKAPLTVLSELLNPDTKMINFGPQIMKSRYMKINDREVLNMIGQDQQWAVEYRKIERLRPDEKDYILHNNSIPIEAQTKCSNGIICRVSEDGCFVLKSVPKLLSKLKQGGSNQVPYRSIPTVDTSTLSELWKEKTNLSTKSNGLTLSMTPPPNLLGNSPEKEHQTPFEYFGDKYYENLYELSIPLTYFVKSSFTRLFNMCDKDPQKYFSVLKRFVISEECFLQRHDLQRNGVMNQSLSKCTSELKYQGKFINQHFNLLDLHEKVTNPAIIDILRFFEVKELQLQILVVLEIIYIEKLDHLELFDEKTRRKEKIDPLVNKKKRLKLDKMKNFQKVLIPSHISTKMTFSSPSNTLRISSPPLLNKIDYNLHLEELLEKCLYAGQILGRKSFGINDLTDDTTSSSITRINRTSSTKTFNNGNSNSSPSMKLDKFTSKIIVPFFGKKCTNTVKFIIAKLKESEKVQYRPTSRREKTTRTSTSTSATTGQKSSMQDTIGTIGKVNEEDKRNDLTSDLSAKSTVPALKRTSLKDHFQPSSSLKRATSDLLSRQMSFTTLNLAKKQMVSFQDVETQNMKQEKRTSDYTKGSSSSTRKPAKLTRHSSSLATKTSSVITFGKSIGKPQSQPQSQIATQQSFTQVEATPLKKNNSRVDLEDLEPPPSFKRSMTLLKTFQSNNANQSENRESIEDEAEITIDSSPIGLSQMMIDSSPILMMTPCTRDISNRLLPLSMPLKPDDQMITSSSPLKDILELDHTEDDFNRSPLSKRRRLKTSSDLGTNINRSLPESKNDLLISSSTPSSLLESTERKLIPSSSTVSRPLPSEKRSFQSSEDQILDSNNSLSFQLPSKLQIISKNPEEYDIIDTSPKNISSHSFGNSSRTLDIIMDTPARTTRRRISSVNKEEMMISDITEPKVKGQNYSMDDENIKKKSPTRLTRAAKQAMSQMEKVKNLK